MTWRLARLGLALGTFLALLGFIRPADVVASLVAAEPGWLLSAVLLLAVATGIGTLGFQSILAARQVTVPFGGILAADLAGHFYALAIPAGVAAGGAVRVLHLAGAGVPVPTVAGAVLVSRLLDILGSAILALAVLPLVAADLAAPVAATVAVGFVAVGSLLAVVATCNLWLRVGLARLIVRLPVSHRRRRCLHRAAIRLGQSKPASLSAHLPALACALARHLVGGAAVLMLAAAMGAELPFAAALWARTVTNFVMLLPLSVAGIGLREVSMVALLTPFGIPAAQALAISLPLLCYQLLLSTMGGVLELGTSLVAFFRRPNRRMIRRNPDQA